MTEHSVDALLAALDATIRTIGSVAVTGELTGWRTHRSGMATAELSSGQPPTARIRIAAPRYAAAAAAGELADAGRTTAATGTVTIHGHVTIHPEWGVQLTLLRLRCIENTPAAPTDHDARPNAALPWPRRIATIGLVAPAGGDDARADVIAHLAPTDLTIVEHRVGVTGPRAAAAIGHALDRLALDPRPDVTLIIRGGGPVSDFAPFDSTLVIAAIGRHPRPVVTGLGHADNHTAADRAAHTSCITPTAAAQLVLATNTQPPQPPSRTSFIPLSPSSVEQVSRDRRPSYPALSQPVQRRVRGRPTVRRRPPGSPPSPARQPPGRARARYLRGGRGWRSGRRQDGLAEPGS